MSKVVHILLVEDNPTDRLLIREMLVDALDIDFSIQEAGSMDECVSYLKEHAFDAILLDLGLPDSQGEQSYLRIIDVWPDIPLLVLTGLEDEEIGVRAMRLGAQDYLVKGEFQSSLLIRSVLYAIERHRISNELRLLATQLGETTRRLSESETRTRELINANADAMIVVDTNNNIKFVNPAGSRMLKKATEELIGHSFPYAYNIEATTEIELPSGIDDSPSFAEVNVVSLEWENSAAKLLTVRDITKRKVFEQELVKFRKWVEHSEESFEIIDSESGRVIDCNQTAYQRLGYSREEMLQLHVWDYDPNITQERWQERAHELKKNKRAKFQSSHIPKGGQTFPVEVSIGLVHLSGKDYFVAVVQDITKRLHDEALIHRDAEILSIIDDAILAFDLNNKITYWNRGATNLLGWSQQERIGKSICSICPDLNEAETRKYFTQSALGSPRMERKIPTKNGKLVCVECALHANTDIEGNPVSYLLMMRDIEDRLSLEAQLRQAQKMEAIGTLAGGIAHDFNNIMASIRGYTELAQRRNEDPIVGRDLETVLLASERATSLIDKILTFTRKQPEARSSIKLQETLHEAIHLLRATLPSTIELNSNIDDSAPTVLANHDQILQIVLNLAANALHAIPKQTGKLSISLNTKTFDQSTSVNNLHLQPGKYVCASVSDNGIGIDREIVDRIFEPFFTTKSPGEGTGLGLAMVHGIMQNHNGAITVESSPGNGATFHLYFPEHGMNTEELASESRNESKGNGEHILFIDDEALLASLGKEALQILGYRVTTCESPLEALSFLNNHANEIDLVITDQTMPGMTGMELAQSILRNFPEMKIIISTGYSATLTPERAHDAGIIDILHKPISITKLSEAVSRAIVQNM